jgi:hypothetical protein
VDLLLELEINDGRRPASKAARKFEKELLRRKTGWYGKKYKPDQDFEISPLVSKYRLMTALQVLVNSGETTYLTDYLSVSNSLRADKRALNLSDMLPNTPDARKDKSDKEEGSAAHDLSRLSVPELRVLHFLVAKLHDEPMDEQQKNIRESLLEILRTTEPPAGLLEYVPVLEGVEPKIRRFKQPKAVIDVMPTPSQGESEEQRDARIQNYHHEKMLKGLYKDPGPWDD